ncbi:hypothetical protein P7M05_23285, partial [Vibrio parahaemolyticus]|nr:hypothetical protein [Vibrio parahaemolyticus]
VASQFKMLASLNSQHPLRSAVGLNTLKPEHNLLCGFGLLSKNWLCLPAIATLLPVVAPLSLGIQGILALLILGHFVRLVLATFLTESPSGFRYVDHLCSRSVCDENERPAAAIPASTARAEFCLKLCMLFL